MSKPLISDKLWAMFALLLPPERPKPKGGRPRSIPDRAALTGTLFVLKSGIPWEMLPQEMGCGSGMTGCDVCAIGNARVSGDACTVRSYSGCRMRDASSGSGPHSIVRVCRLPRGDATGNDPTNRGKLGAKRHVVVARMGLPLAITI